ncbi:hypothetical protein MTR67_036023 [Solanum verrucosum]|uniref:Uncharacterized protein n=1 Tax=Solanum verrucosum TaxID=315347 RepID=A0AAF0UAX7_SOLVR|nr:hypothetical protein MTR67_036023 [Solanum verrucosum]
MALRFFFVVCCVFFTFLAQYEGAKDPCRPQDGPGPVVPIANLTTNHGCVPFNYMGFNCSCCTTTPGVGCFSTWNACLTSKCLPYFPPVQLT